MTDNCLKIKKLETGPIQIQVNLDSIRSADTFLNDFVDNYAIISKKDISGLSTYVCNKCLAFQFQYLKDIGIDLTAEQRHRCIPVMFYDANNLPDQNRIQRLNELRQRGTLHFIEMTNSIFAGKKEIVVHSTLLPANLGYFHAPKIRLVSMTADHWAWIPIILKEVALTDIGLKNFVGLLGSTYALLCVQN